VPHRAFADGHGYLIGLMSLSRCGI